MRNFLEVFCSAGTYVSVLVEGEWYGGTIDANATEWKTGVFVLRNYRKDMPPKFVSVAHVAMVQESDPGEDW